MESSLKNSLKAAGVSGETITVLEEELVLTSVVFNTLREEHFERLLPMLKVGNSDAGVGGFNSTG